ncbi:MAG: hypothetical protein GEU82_04695 [Luteitalea sp.]|nr:hypothetical protein [Luteitalea sp.]
MDPMLVVTTAAVALASTMSLVAWRVVRDDRRRSEARVAALAADIHRVGAGAGDDPPPWDHGGDDPATLFAAVPPQPRRSALAIAIGAGALVLGGAAAVFMTVTGGQDPVTPAGASAQLVQASPEATGAPASPPALELVALDHERGQDRFTVRGSVRNPDTTAAVKHLTAVVLLLTGDGGFLTSGRGEVGAGGLAPGTEASFEIIVPGAAQTGRYRVSFRNDDRVVPHVDRRRQ